MPTRKTVSVDVLRQLLGDSRTDEVLEKLTPSKPTIPVAVESLSLARTLYADPLTESRHWADTVPVIRRYFLERGPSRRAFLAWLDQSQLERRRAAMAKARKVRRQRLETQRAGDA